MKNVTSITSRPRFTAPKGLSAEARKLWSDLHGEYQIEDAAGIALLGRLGESLDRLRQAQKDIAKNGLSISDQKGSKKMNPACHVEKEAHKQMLEALRPKVK